MGYRIVRSGIGVVSSDRSVLSTTEALDVLQTEAGSSLGVRAQDTETGEKLDSAAIRKLLGKRTK